MNRVEIITVRMEPQNQEQLIEELRKTLNSRSRSSDQVAVRIFREARVETDLSVHLYLETVDADSDLSDLGQCLASELKNYGPVNHTLWLEEEAK